MSSITTSKGLSGVLSSILCPRGASPGSVQVFESTNSFSSDLTGMVSYKPQRNAFVGGEVGFLAAEITR